jgi:hypothetical protein
VKEFLQRVRRASSRSPRYLAGRLLEAGRARSRRPWATIYPHLLTERSVVKAAGAESIDALWTSLEKNPFFINSADRVRRTEAFRARYPDAAASIVEAAERFVGHEFDLLGSGSVSLGRSLPWHTDFKACRDWPLQYASDIDYMELDRPTDVKVPWELSRCQHFTTLGQAYWLTGDQRYAQEFAAEIEDWIARNPWGYGVNWACAMDVALRAANWIWGFHFFAGSAACQSPQFRGAFVRALYLHGSYIATHLERGDINGNHYLCDGVGLIFVGTFLRATSSGRRWLEQGKAIVADEIFNQTATDGVDFEKSTAYHRLVLEAFLTSHLLLQLHGEPLSAAWVDRLERMIEFVEAYTKPDGTIPLIGDADDGRIQKLGGQRINDHRYLLSAGAVLFGRGDFKRAAGCFRDEAFWLLSAGAGEKFDALETATTALTSKAFHDGGFYVLRSDRAHVIVDCGDVGMHGRGGHGHSDITSVEVWLDGMNLVTDCGAYLYTASRESRNAFRSTAYHNVVQVDGEELNRLISPDHLWQLRDDARPYDVSWAWGELQDCFRGGHTGFARLDPPVLVTREVFLNRESPEVFVRDAVQGGGRPELVWRFHFDPHVDVAIDGRDVKLSHAGRESWLQIVDAPDDLTLLVDSGWVSPSYGVKTPIHVLIMRSRAGLPVTASVRFGLVRYTQAQLQSCEMTCVDS